MKTNRIYYQTVTPQLIKVLHDLMAEPLFDSFRLVGGPSLSLQRGHRKSIDIDLLEFVES